MKKRILLFILLIVLLGTSIVSAKEKEYRIKDLNELFLQESLSIKRLEIDRELSLHRNDRVFQEYSTIQAQVIASTLKLNELSSELGTLNNLLIEAGDAEKPAIQTQIALVQQQYGAESVRYYSLLDQESRLLASLQTISVQSSRSTLKKEQEVERLKYDLQKDYYNIVMLLNQKELLEGNYRALARQLEVERIKERFNMSTYLDILSISNRLRDVEINIRKLENTISLAVDRLRFKLNVKQGHTLNIIFEAPSRPLSRTYNLEALQKNFNDKNISLELAKTNIASKDILLGRGSSSYRVAELEKSEAEIDKETLEKNLEVLVKQVYYKQEESKNNLSSEAQNINIAEIKLRQATLRYELGLISRLQLELEKNSVIQARLSYNQAKINYVNAISEVELINMGITP